MTFMSKNLILGRIRPLFAQKRGNLPLKPLNFQENFMCDFRKILRADFEKTCKLTLKKGKEITFHTEKRFATKLIS